MEPLQHELEASYQVVNLDRSRVVNLNRFMHSKYGKFDIEDYLPNSILEFMSDLGLRITTGPEKVDQIERYEPIKKYFSDFGVVWKSLPVIYDIEDLKNFPEAKEYLNKIKTELIHASYRRLSNTDLTVLNYLSKLSGSLIFSFAYILRYINWREMAELVLVSNLKLFNGTRIDNMTKKEFHDYLSTFEKIDKDLKIFYGVVNEYHGK